MNEKYFHSINTSLNVVKQIFLFDNELVLINLIEAWQVGFVGIFFFSIMKPTVLQNLVKKTYKHSNRTARSSLFKREISELHSMIIP